MEDYIFFKEMFNNVDNIRTLAAPSHTARKNAQSTVKYHSSWFNIIPLSSQEKVTFEPFFKKDQLTPLFVTSSPDQTNDWVTSFMTFNSGLKEEKALVITVNWLVQRLYFLSCYTRLLQEKNKNLFSSTFSLRSTFLSPVPAAKGNDAQSILSYLLDFMIFVQKENLQFNWLDYLLRMDNLSLTSRVKKKDYVNRMQPPWKTLYAFHC
jgi:hypothetical protein